MIRKVFRLLSEVRKNPYFGFIQGHDHLSPTDLAEIHKLVGSDNLDIIEEFEQGFAGIVGDGQAVSFASGRMGFYALMQVLGIQAGDEDSSLVDVQHRLWRSRWQYFLCLQRADSQTNPGT